MHELMTFAARHRRLLTALVVATVVALGFAALEHLAQEIRFADVRAAFHAVSYVQIAAALLLTAGSYIALTFYDFLALRIIGRPLPWRTAALASFTSYTLSHTLGLSLLTGGSARYRIYSTAGLDGPDIARVIGVASATFWMGVLTVAGAALATHQGSIDLPGISISAAAARASGVVLILLMGGVILLCALRRKPLAWRRFQLPLPSAGQAVVQIGIAVADLAFASAALYVLIPGADPALLPSFILAYALGIIASVITHVPGGVGVFEAVVIAVLPGDRATIFAALIAYRLIYYLLPLAIGVLLLAGEAGARNKASLSGLRAVAGSAAPMALSAATFLTGAMLLLSGALPALPWRLKALEALLPLPLPLIEASHILASIIGALLLLIAPGLYRRLDGASMAVRALLLAAAACSLLKGFDFEEAFVCLALFVLLHWTRGAFYRRTALTQAPLSPAWFASVATVLGLSVWAGLFAYRHVPYDGELWLQFALHGDASRFLRATLGVGLVLCGFAIWRLLGPTPADRIAAPTGQDIATVREVLTTAQRTEAMLALTGDKLFLFSSNHDAFLMYRVSGVSWIVMGDPVGSPAAWPDLLWRMRDMTDRHQGRLLLYEVSPHLLDLAIGMGLQVIKFGEEAVVDLRSFALDTPRLRAARRSERAAAKKGATFDIVPRAQAPALLDALEQVSDAWMADKGQREKSFSLGRFDRDYLSNFDIAVVRVDGRIVAFANLWLTENRNEASIDLMRHVDDAPSGTMDFLFVQLMVWAGAQGYARFSLGMAPLSGIEGRRLSPTWAKLASFAFRHGERFYGFKGLRAYKEKFAPDWEPRYIAGPHGVGLVQAMRDLSRLVNNAPPLENAVSMASGSAEFDAPHPDDPISDPVPGLPRSNARDITLRGALL